MIKRALFFYIMTVLALTSVHGQAICKNAGFKPVGTACYKYIPVLMLEPQARANCESLNGTLAKFTSLDSMREVCLKLKAPPYTFWIDASEDVQQKGIQWAGNVQSYAEYFFIFPEGCSQKYDSLCIERDEQSLPTTTTITKEDIQHSNATMTTPKVCLHDNYTPVDGVCYRLSPEIVSWQDANTHCNKLNGTLASFSSVQQGIDVLKTLNHFDKYAFVNIYNKNMTSAAKLGKSFFVVCTMYVYVQYHDMNTQLPVLCKEMPNTIKPCIKKAKADIIFLMDASSSIGSKNWKLVTNFSAEVAQNFVVGPDDVQFGAIVFNSDVKKIFDLNSYKTKSAVYTAISEIPYPTGTGTFTYRGFRKIREDKLFSAIYGGRTNVTRIVIVLTDGESANKVKTLEEAALLKKDNIIVMSVGVGKNINLTELRGMASDPNKYVFMVDNFDLLNQIKNDIVSVTCEKS